MLCMEPKCTHKAMRKVLVGRKGPFQTKFDLCWKHTKVTLRDCWARVIGTV